MTLLVSYFFQTMDRLLSGRLCFASLSLGMAKLSMAVAVKFSECRPGFGPSPQAVFPVMSYGTQVRNQNVVLHGYCRELSYGDIEALSWRSACTSELWPVRLSHKQGLYSHCSAEYDIASLYMVSFYCFVTKACARRPSAAASVDRRRRERRTLLAEAAGELAGATRARQARPLSACTFSAGLAILVASVDVFSCRCGRSSHELHKSTQCKPV